MSFVAPLGRRQRPGRAVGARGFSAHRVALLLLLLLGFERDCGVADAARSSTIERNRKLHEQTVFEFSHVVLAKGYQTGNVASTVVVDKDDNSLFSGTFRQYIEWPGVNGSRVVFQSTLYTTFVMKFATAPRLESSTPPSVNGSRTPNYARSQKKTKSELVALWGRQFINLSYYSQSYPTSIVVDSDGSAVVTGTFYGEILVDEYNYLIGDRYASSIFFVKYDKHGNVLWAKTVQGTSVNYCGSLAIDENSHSLYAVGYFGKDLIFDDAAIHSNYLNYFLVKMNADGDVMWVLAGNCTSSPAAATDGARAPENREASESAFKEFQAFHEEMRRHPEDAMHARRKLMASAATGSAFANSVDVDAHGNPTFVGTFSGILTFQRKPNDSAVDRAVDVDDKLVLTSVGAMGLYLVKYDADGKGVLWAISAGGNRSLLCPHVHYLAVDLALDRHYVCGCFNGTLHFYDDHSAAATEFEAAFQEEEEEEERSARGDRRAIAATVNNTRGYGMYLASYNSRGRLLWATRTGGTQTDYGAALTTTPDGNAVVMGFYQDSAVFPSLGSAQEYVQVQRKAGAFVAKYNHTGRVVWGTGFYGALDVGGIAADRAGNLLSVGTFRGYARFYTDRQWFSGNDSFYFFNLTSQIQSMDEEEIWWEDSRVWVFGALSVGAIVILALLIGYASFFAVQRFFQTHLATYFYDTDEDDDGEINNDKPARRSNNKADADESTHLKAEGASGDDFAYVSLSAAFKEAKV